MWLISRTEAERFRYSPYRLAVVRVLVGVTLALLALVLPDVAPAVVPSWEQSWSELPRIVRGGLRLLLLALSVPLVVGFAPRVVASAAVVVVLVLVGFGRMDGRAGLGIALLLLVVGSYPGSIRLAWPRHEEIRGVVEAEARRTLGRWFRWAWLALGLLWLLVPLWAATSATPWVLALALMLWGRVLWRGPVRAATLAFFAAALVVSVTINLPAWWLWLAGLSCLLTFDESWIRPTQASVEPPIVFFDGVCALCNDSVQLIVDEEQEPRLRFAPLQGEIAERLLGPTASHDPDTFVLWQDGHSYRRSEAALRIADQMGGFWRLLAWVLRLVPHALRDVLYSWVAKNRYSWFGKLEQCRIPAPEQRERFLD